MQEYSTVIQWSEEDEGYIAAIPALPGLSAFGSTREEALKELEVAKEAYIEVYEEDGCELPEPDTLNSFSGQTRLRLTKGLHASLSREAKMEGVSLNTYIVQLLSERNYGNKVERRFKELEDTLQDLTNQKQSVHYVLQPDAQAVPNAIYSQEQITAQSSFHAVQIESDETDRSLH
jgi:predicted RNase H-like HicB family nuclease